MTRIHVDGVATTKFVKRTEVELADLAAGAALDALVDAGIKSDEIGLIVCGSVHGGDGLGQRIASRLGIGRVPIINTENACASSSVAAMIAGSLMRDGVADAALVVGAEMMSERAGSPIVDSHSSYDYDAHDVSWPVMYALNAAESIACGDFDEADIAAVAVNNRYGASLNPHAQFTSPISIDEVLESRPVAGPIRLLMCSPRSDGASALVLSSDGRVSERPHPDVVIRASHLLAGDLLDGVDRPRDAVTAAAARQIYKQAGIGPADIDVVELHDAFASAELDHLVSLGVCEPGEAGDLVRRQIEGVNSRWVNPSGGLLSRGHPIGATGAAQLAELTLQLRGEAGDRQVPGARLGLCHTMGGTVFELESNACMLHVLECVA